MMKYNVQVRHHTPAGRWRHLCLGGAGGLAWCCHGLVVSRKPKKGNYLLTRAAHQLYLLIYNYIRSLLHCSSEEYCDCSIRVSRIVDAIELGSQ